MTSERPSPWTTPFAWRTYAAGVAWTLGLLVSWLTGVPDLAGWLQLRTDPGGLLFLVACVVGGMNFVGSGVRAAMRLKLDMNFLMSAALVSALLIGEPFEAATLAFLFSAAELLELPGMGPKRIEKFVRYMPMVGPHLGSREAAERRLFERWKQYLDEAEQTFAS